MPADYWWIWMGIAAAFVVGEIFTAGFFLMWFGIGAGVAGVLALLKLGPGWQWAAFIAISFGLFAVSRRFAERVTKAQPPGIGADRAVGKRGVVIEVIDNDKNTGRVRMDREEWRAESDRGDVIPLGARVEVVQLSGTHLVVNAIKEGTKNE